MSQENLLSLDEGALRKLLEATLDLAERRQIRSAIRELRRQQLEQDEGTLASKRFRSERGSHRQENKENWLRSQQLEEEQQKSLALLSRKLESITDLEELTALLRGAGEYEERKLIRAAIRKLRAEEIEAAALAGQVYSSRRGDDELLGAKGKESADGGYSVIQELENLEEQEKIRAQIGEPHSEQRREPQNPDGQDTASGTLLLLDPLPNQHPSSSSLSLEPELEPESQQRAESPKCSSQGTDSEPEAEQSCKSTWKEESLESSSTMRKDGKVFSQPAGVSDKTSQEEPEQQGVPAPIEDSQVEKSCPSLSSTASQSSQFIICIKDQVSKKPAGITDQKRAASTHDVPGAPAHLGTRQSEHMQSMLFFPPRASSTEPLREQPFQRTNSVRERARKFTSETLGPSSLASPRPGSQKWESIGKGSRVLQQQQHFLHPESARGLHGAYAQHMVDLPTGVRCGLSPARAVPSGAKAGAQQAISPAEQSTSSLEEKAAIARHPTGPPVCPKEEGSSRRRGQAGQSQGGLLPSPWRSIENSEGSTNSSEQPSIQQVVLPPCRPAQPQLSAPDTKASAKDKDTMKTCFTIEIKDGRTQPASSCIVGRPGSQQAELTLGLRSTPIRITTTTTSNISSTGNAGPAPVLHSSSISNVSKMDPELVEQPQVMGKKPELSNGIEKAQVKELDKRSKLSAEELSRIEDEDILDKMLDQRTDFEERRLIRAAMRELRQRKREQREKERDHRLQEMKSQPTAGRAGHATETTTRQSTQSADGSAHSTVTKTERLIQSNDGSKTSRMTTVESSYVKRSENGSTFRQTKSSYSSSSKKVGSVFDREDETTSRQGSLAALERRQAEKKKELMKAQSLPKTSATQARKAMIEKLEKESGGASNPAVSRVAVQRTSSFGVPNASSIKQMLLDWCRAKTRGYEHVDIQNFSSSWSDGMAFCALVHNFFPEAFDYSELTPQNRRHNFEVAFSSAEKHAECPQLLDVEDMVRMREPDWKCVYTYIQEFYRCLVQKGLVKTKKS
ncbi:smoothelin isoform X2 [Alligator sinensis]|uniref:Smoothelin isoform X2 n=1 Tax=Alligator sinensis TaxID=38654 RepID=A0A1U8DSG0_ALLSI|nr:smoothelin isoform X2 [Alligator sinensis]XP_025072405.1 smoothelin isoform X2 [Alligator sinensis]